MPFIYIHTPFCLDKIIRKNLRRKMSEALMRVFPEWKLQKENIHLAFTEERHSIGTKRPIMIKTEALMNTDVVERKKDIARAILSVIKLKYPKKEIRSLIVFHSHEVSDFATTEKCKD